MIWGYFPSLVSPISRTCAAHPSLQLFLSEKKLTTLALGVSNQPLQRDVNVVLLLARDAVAANLPVLYAGKVHSLNQSSFIERSSNIPLVAEYQHRNPNQLGLVQQRVQLIPGRFHLVQVGRIHHVDDCVHPAAVPLPHRPETRLTANVPHLDRNVALRHLSHVEAHRRDHVLAKLARGNNVHKGGLSGVLQPDQGQFHFLLPEQALEPIQDSVDEGQHSAAAAASSSAGS